MPRDYDQYETYGVFEYSARKKYATKMIQEVKWNPIFWLSVAFTIFSAICLIIHSFWGFAFGSLFSLMSLVIGGACIYLCFLSRFKKPWYQLWKREVARIVFFCIFCMSLQGLFISVNVELLKNHFAGSDHGWNSFPFECEPNKGGVILNCVRTGYNIPNPYTSPALDPIANKSFSQDQNFVLHQLTNIAESHMNCEHLQAGSDWVHLRCLSELFGRPSDLAIRVFPNPAVAEAARTNEVVNRHATGLVDVTITPNEVVSEFESWAGYGSAAGNGNATYVWVHSQSRDPAWDRNANDGLVRLLFMYKYLCDTSQGGVSCRKSI